MAKFTPKRTASICSSDAMRFLSGLEKRDVYLATYRRHFNPLSRWGQSKCRATERCYGFGRCFYVEVIGPCRYEKLFSRALNTSHLSEAKRSRRIPRRSLKVTLGDSSTSLG